MKNPLIHISILILTSLLTVVSLAGNCRAATQSFTVVVPERLPFPTREPVARIKITLDVASPVAANTLVVDTGGTETLQITTADLATNHFYVKPNGANLFQFYSPPGSNTVIIDITLAADFATPGDFFNPKPNCPTGAPACNTFPFDIPMTFDGPAISGFRLSSYGALSTVAKGTVTRRLDVNAADWKVGGKPSGTDKGRHGLDVMLVLDKSGSMGDTVPAILSPSGDIKMDVLKTTVKQFIDAWKADAPPGSEDDRLGVTFFQSPGADDPLLFGGVFLVPRGPAGVSPHPWNQIKTQIDARSDGGSTDLGDGIREAIRRWKLDPKNDPNIVVMTNGIQNDGNMVGVDGGTGLRTLKGPAAADPVVPLINQRMPIQTIGVGAEADVQSTLLDEVASQTGGVSNLKTVSTMDFGFISSLVSILKGNTISIISQEEKTLAAGASTGAPTTVDLNPAVSRAIFILGWFGPANANALDLQIFRPGNVQVTPVSKETSSFYTVQTVDLPTTGPAGQWTAKVVRSGASTAPILHHLTVLAADGRFAYRIDFAKIDPATGEPIILRVDVSDKGSPLPALGTAITARVKRPLSPLGSVLRSFNVSPSVLTTNPPGHDPDSFPNQYTRKLFNFLNTSQAGTIQSTEDPQPITLFDDGQAEHGDDKAGDGVYSLKYTNTKTPGLYKFKLLIDINNVSLGKISRFEERETVVAVRVPDAKQSEVLATRETPSSYRIDIVPADRFGNFLGPGFAEAIRLTLSGGGTVGTSITDERENGTYTIRITGIPSGADPVVVVKVSNVEIANGTLSSLSKPSKRFAVFGGIGGNFPHGDFNTFFDSGFSSQLGFEYRFTNRFSAEGTFGFDRFGFAFGSSNLDLYRLSANAKFYPVIGTFQFGVFAGGGVYHFNPSSTHGGLNVGAVGEYRINTSWSVESTYNFHNVFTSGSNTRFSTLQGGVRFRF
jgi:hypothetical protein